MVSVLFFLLNSLCLHSKLTITRSIAELTSELMYGSVECSLSSICYIVKKKKNLSYLSMLEKGFLILKVF